MQADGKKCAVYGAVVFMWIFIPVYVTTIGSVGTDIVKGICVPWGTYGSYTVEVAITSSAFLIAYLLPLTTMTYCYVRIVYALRYKVGDVGLPVIVISGLEMYILSQNFVKMKIQPKAQLLKMYITA